MINEEALRNSCDDWFVAKPFPHVVIDDFLDAGLASEVYDEFPAFDSTVWHDYHNPLEVKRVCNNWNLFPTATYQLFTYLNSEYFCGLLRKALGLSEHLIPDSGLNGGGWHIHGRGGRLNHHLDYSLHPKLQLQRKINIIIYLCPDWQQDWGGQLGFWGNESSDAPGPLVKTTEPSFNRAVIFDTTQNSWHGLANPVTAPANRFRKSLAVYYLCEPPEGVNTRGKALFAPTGSQVGDSEVLDLIKRRSGIETADSAYIYNEGEY